jgi:DNA-3-methyladenine glycosylase
MPTEHWARLDRSFFERGLLEVARGLIGVRLALADVGGVIVEVEAYEPADPASHAYRGRTAYNDALFSPPGCAYIHRSHGIHWCLNFTCTEPGTGILVRALEPTCRLDVMAARRGVSQPKLLCSGPGRLGQALQVSRDLNGLPLDAPPFQLDVGPVRGEIAVGRRIGLTKGVETPWRFGLAGSPFLSRPFRDG